MNLSRPEYLTGGNGKKDQNSSNKPNPPTHSDDPANLSNFLASRIR